MVSRNPTVEEFQEAPPLVSEWRRFIKVFLQRKIVIFGLVVLVILLLTAIFAEILAPHDPYRGNLADALVGPNSTYWLGTDIQGRDLLSRLIFGTRTVLMVGFVTVGIAAVAGVTLGITAGYFGGIVSMLIMRVMDALMAFPMLILAMLFAAVLGGGIQNVIIALSIATLPGYARVMNGQLGGLILAEAALSFFGIGIKPPGAAWGAMVFDGYRYGDLPLLSIVPGVAIMLVVFAFNMVGDGLRDALDPRLRGIL